MTYRISWHRNPNILNNILKLTLHLILLYLTPIYTEIVLIVFFPNLTGGKKELSKSVLL